MWMSDVKGYTVTLNLLEKRWNSLFLKKKKYSEDHYPKGLLKHNFPLCNYTTFSFSTHQLRKI